MKKFIRNLLPSKKTLENHLGESRYAKKILQSNCFHINHRSVSRAVAIGLFFAFIPIPLQMLLAATTAIYLRANFIIAITMTWITNPITFLPFNYIIFTVGHYVTRNNEAFHPIPEVKFEIMHLSAIFTHYGVWIKEAGTSFIVGIPIVATVSAIVGYISIEIFWRFHLYIIKRKRKK